MMKKYLTLLAVTLAAVACGEDNPVDPTPTPVAPTSITLSKSSFEIAQAGETVSLDITAPARPQVTGMPSWITYKDGTYKDFKMSVNFVVAANDTYESRTASISVASAGVSAQTVSFSQPGKEYTPTPVDPSPQDNDAWKMAATLGLGWNLGNQFDGYYNGSWAGEKEGFPD